MKHFRRRVALSEILGSLVMISITLIAGIGVFGFVNGQAANSAAAVGNNAAININFLNEHEVLVYAGATLPLPSGKANIWVYNNGAEDLKISQVLVISYGASGGSVTTCNAGTSMPTIPRPTPSGGSSSLLKINVYNNNTNTVLLCPASLSFAVGNTYTFKVVGQFGSSAQASVAY